MGGPSLVLLLLLLLLASAFFSGSEVALFALNRIQLRRMQKSGDRRERRVARLLARPAVLLSTILVGNTLANVSSAALITSLALALLREHPDVAAGLAIGFDLLVVLALGEVLPKTVAIRAPERCARLVAEPLALLQLLFRPLVLLLSAVAALLLRLAGLQPALRPGGSVSATDLRSLFEALDDGAGIPLEERRIARRVFEFSTGRAAEVMTPRVDIRAIERHVSSQTLIEVMRSTKHARLPVYEGDIDAIIGFISAKQFLLNPERPPGSLLRPVLFVPENKRVSDIFHELQRRAIGMAVVVDEYGHTAGIITKEDLVEEIVGEIYDEFEAEQAPLVKLGPRRYLVGGLLAVSDLVEVLGVPLESESVTVNGLLAEILGRIPRAGEVVEHAGVMFQVGEVRRHRVVRCVVRLIEGRRGERQEAPRPQEVEAAAPAAAARPAPEHAARPGPPESAPAGEEGARATGGGGAGGDDERGDRDSVRRGGQQGERQ